MGLSLKRRSAGAGYATAADASDNGQLGGYVQHVSAREIHLWTTERTFHERESVTHCKILGTTLGTIELKERGIH